MCDNNLPNNLIFDNEQVKKQLKSLQDKLTKILRKLPINISKMPVLCL